MGRLIEELLREYDPGSVEPILSATDRFEDPARYVISLLTAIRRFNTERSGGMHGPILDRLNRFVRLEDGSPVRGLSVALSPAEVERYETREIGLADLPDRSEFLSELDTLISEIAHETESRGELQ